MTEPSAPTVAPTDHGALASAPTTLSGRPAIEVSTAPRTRVSRGAVLGVGLVIALAVTATAVVLLRRGPDGTDVRAMAPGQCYVETDVVQDHGRPIPHGRDTPCMTSAPRVVAVVPMPIGPFPANIDFDAVVEGHCGGEQDFVILPTEASWLDGDRTVVCIALPEV